MSILITGGSGFIGTNLVDFYAKKGEKLINLDWNPPLNPAHNVYWHEVNIMDLPALKKIFHQVRPTAVVHLAARTDSDIFDLDANIGEYIQNTHGTRNVLDAIKSVNTVERVVISSTQFVCEAGYIPKHDMDFKPYTLYGKSKVYTEIFTRQADLGCTWTLIRPSTIWGPWSLRYRDLMFPIIQKGLYFHPDKKNVWRSYGYVKNLIYQLDKILTAPPMQVHKKVFYTGDTPVNLYQWANAINRELTGKDMRVLPSYLVHGIALTGDILRHFGLHFPITSTRFHSMTQDYITPIQDTIHTLGTAPYTLEEGVAEMVDWYKNHSKGIPLPQKRFVQLNKDFQFSGK